MKAILKIDCSKGLIKVNGHRYLVKEASADKIGNKKLYGNFWVKAVAVDHKNESGELDSVTIEFEGLVLMMDDLILLTEFLTSG